MRKIYVLLCFFISISVCCEYVIADVAPKYPYSLYNKSLLKSSPKIVITDINNTLIETWQPTQELINRCLVRLHEPKMSLEEINALPPIHPVDIIWSRTNKDLSTIEKIYTEELAALTKHAVPPIPIKGAYALLSYLKSKNIPIIVISSDDKKILYKNLDKLGWTKFFITIVTKNEAPNNINKPDPKVVEYALEKAGLNKKDYDPTSIWFMGDSYGDVKCAAAANVVPIWIEKKAATDFNFVNNGIKIIVIKNLEGVLNLIKQL
jgi:phosphoglycolate phosphatase-like HAD superfamily hydrolase